MSAPATPRLLHRRSPVAQSHVGPRTKAQFLRLLPSFVSISEPFCLRHITGSDQSGNNDRVGDQKKEKPGQEKPVTTTATEEKPAPSLEEEKPAPSLQEEKPPVPEAKPVLEAKTEEKPVEDKPEVKPVLAPAKPASKPAAQMAGDHGNIQIINNAAAWKAKLEEAKNAGKLVVVDFTATWCGPCRLMSPIFTELSKKFESLLFLKVDVDEVQDVTAEWEVRAMPTFLFIKDGEQVDRIVGANKHELERKCNRYASTTVSSSA